MENNAEALKNLSLTLDRYKKNKTLVPKSELEGRYKVSFEKLKEQLRTDLQTYIADTVFFDIKADKKDADVLAQEINGIYDRMCIGSRIGKAAYTDFDIESIKRIARELREAVLRAYDNYLGKHTCIYAKAACLDAGTHEQPLIYNDIMDKFWNEQTKEWQTPEPGEKDGAVLQIYLRG